MNGDLYFDGKRYISSSRAAKITGYVNDYIGQLCRDGKLDCRMIGRTWYVSFDALITHKNFFGSGKKILRKKSSKSSFQKPLVSNNSNLRIFSTTSEPQNVSLSEKLQAEGKVVLSDGLGGVLFDKFEEDKLVRKVPKNDIELKIFSGSIPSEIWSLPSGPLVSYVLEEIRKEEEKQDEHREFLTYIFPQAVAGIVSLFIALSSFWFALDANKDAQIAYSNIYNSVRDISERTLVVAGDKVQANVSTPGRKILDKAGLFVYEKTNDLLFKTKTKILVMIGDKKISEKVVENGVTISNPSQGLVVVPTDSRTDRQAVLTKIKNSFSDEVTVEPGKDGTDGVITPVFKQGKGDDYLYVLVPIKN